MINHLLMRMVPEGWHIRIGSPVVLPGASVPEPDISVPRGTIDDYIDRDVTAADLALAAEVADSSLAWDAGPVLRAFAAARIPIYWIINIPERVVDVYEQPSGPVAEGLPGYGQQHRYRPGDTWPLVLDGREVGRVAAADLLSPRSA